MTLNEIILTSLIYCGGIFISLVLYFFFHTKFVNSSNKKNNNPSKSLLTNLIKQSDSASQSIEKEKLQPYLKLQIEPMNSNTINTQTNSTSTQGDIKRKPRYVIVNKQGIQEYKKASNY